MIKTLLWVSNLFNPCNTIQIFLFILHRDTRLVSSTSDVFKGKVKLSLCLTKHHAMKTYWGVEVKLHDSLTSTLEGGEWSVSRPSRFTPRERAPGTHWIGGWVGPGAVLDAVVKRKIPSPRRESNPKTPIVQPIIQRCTDWAATFLRLFVSVSEPHSHCNYN
jgi:hypothetical protein